MFKWLEKNLKNISFDMKIIQNPDFNVHKIMLYWNMATLIVSVLSLAAFSGKSLLDILLYGNSSPAWA